ncbi:MAG: 3'-5' exonuclease [Chloroflexota bacterium]
MRRVLDLAGALPGLRRVDLVTNYRCPRPVVERAVRLITANTERFAKSIRARDGAAGTLALAPDSGDDLDRARRLLTTWLPAEPGGHAILARTNIELAPYAAVALERGIPYRAAEDGLLLDDPALDGVLASLPSDERPAITLARRATNRLTRSLVAWSLPYRTAADLRAAITAARQQRTALRSDDAQLVLATAHGTKGLEFDHVAVIGMDEHVFPSRRTLEDSDDPKRALEEERRLAYVAWTRARKSLTLVYDPTAPSIFMREAFSPAELALETERGACVKRATACRTPRTRCPRGNRCRGRLPWWHGPRPE